LRSQFQSFQSFNRFAPFKSLRETEEEIDFFRSARDRRRYLHWLFEAKKRFGLCALDYMIRSNQS
jgi:hypothetical protein